MKLPPVLKSMSKRVKGKEQQAKDDINPLQALFNIEPTVDGLFSDHAQQEINFDAIDDQTLSQFIQSCDTEQFKKATQFLNGQDEVFKKCCISSEKTFSNVTPVSQESEEVLTQFIKELTFLSDDDDFMVLKQMMQNRACGKFHFDFASLVGSKTNSVERFLKKFQITEPRFLKGRVKGSKSFRLMRVMRRSAKHPWARSLALRAHLYHHYFISRLFSSGNCIITCWLFCFCASLFHWVLNLTPVFEIKLKVAHLQLQCTCIHHKLIISFTLTIFLVGVHFFADVPCPLSAHSWCHCTG